jgi:hypothetical protein
MELAVPVLVDNPPSPFTTLDRLALLKERSAAWKYLKLVELLDIPMTQGHI